MTISPLAPGALIPRRTGESFTTMRREFDDLQRQLVSGKRADTYSGLGTGRRTSIDTRARLAAIEGYQAAIANGDLRLRVASQGLDSVSKTLSNQKKQAMLTTVDPATGGRAALQQSAMNNLKHVIDVLNTEVNGRYLFSGRKDGTRPVASLETILDGAGGLTGLRQAVAAAATADVGTSLQPGHLQSTPASNVATVAETMPGSTLNGFSLRADGPASGSPSIGIARAGTTLGTRSISFTVGAGLADGETVRLTLGLKDGTSIPIELRARTGGTTADRTSFRIGPTPDDSAANLADAVRQAALAATTDPRFVSASAVAAADRFFAGGIPGAVTWYDGEGVAPTWLAAEPPAHGTDPEQAYSAEARGGVPVRADANLAIGIGARANELPFRNALAGLAVMAIATFSTDPALHAAESARFEALRDRTSDRLDPQVGPGNVKGVLSELANATVSLKTAGDRQLAAESIWKEALGTVENADPEEVAAALRTLQVKMEASYQTTSILSRLSLVNYL